MKLFNFSPLTVKRLERFRRSRIAFGSLILLIVLYCISLCSELICNSEPLLMRYDGEWSMPFLQSQPSEKIRAAEQARLKAFIAPHHVDFRAFVKSPYFDESRGDYALFAPIPYSPHETTDISELNRHKVVTLSLIPRQAVGRFNLTADHKVVLQDGCNQFFPQADLRNTKSTLESLIVVSPELQAELTKRLEGAVETPFQTLVTPAAGTSVPWEKLQLTLSPTAADQATVRVNLAPEQGVSFLPAKTFAFRYSDDGPVFVAEKSSETPDASLAEPLMQWAKMGFENDITASDNLTWTAPNGTEYQVFAGNNLRLPFGPTREHIFGLDDSGRDVFSRILYATRIAVSFGLLLSVAATIIGLIIGALQGYFGGKLDIVVQRFTEIWAALPFLYIMVLVGSVFGRSFWLLLLVYGLFCWIGLSYYMRAEFLRLRGRPFVAAARCQGLNNVRIIFRHILPNALTPIITLFPFLLVGAIGALVSLDFLGFGLPPLTPSWGELLNKAQTHREAWWLILFPSMAIFTVMFLTVMVGEGVRNAFDPKPFSKLQ